MSGLVVGGLIAAFLLALVVFSVVRESRRPEWWEVSWLTEDGQPITPPIVDPYATPIADAALRHVIATRAELAAGARAEDFGGGR